MDFSNAYDTGIGEWDKVTVAYAYSDFPKGTDEKKALNAILEQAQKNGLRYLSDQDARPLGSAHTLAHLWDNGASASQELERVLEIRKRAIANFSEDNIKSGEPYAQGRWAKQCGNRKQGVPGKCIGSHAEILGTGRFGDTNGKIEIVSAKKYWISKNQGVL